MQGDNDNRRTTGSRWRRLGRPDRRSVIIAVLMYGGLAAAIGLGMWLRR